MKNVLIMALVFLFGFQNLQAQVRTQRSAFNKNFKATPPAPCKEVLNLSLKNGVVQNPNNTKSTKVSAQLVGGQFCIAALTNIKESHYQWFKLPFKPGFPNAKIKGVKVHYSVQPSPNNSKRNCYISQTRMVQGPKKFVGTVKIDDGKNLYGAGNHTAKHAAGFNCGTNWKTVALKLVMSRGDRIFIRKVEVLFECQPPIIIDYLCPVNLPSPNIKLASKKAYSTGAGSFVRYNIPVTNSAVYPNFLFDAAPQLPACGANPNSARTWVDIFDERNNRIYGFCALGKSADLKTIWFSVKRGHKAPKRVRIVMHDRGCNKKYASNWISIK